MRILALDQSVTRSGWALIENAGRRRFPVELSGWFASLADSDEAKLKLFKDHVAQLVLDVDPHLLVWEKPAKYLSKNQGRGVNAHQLLLTRLDEALLGIADRFDLLHDAVAANTWRSKVLGKGSGNLSRRDAKLKALAYCKWIGLTTERDDVAEAICIGLWAASCSPVVAEYERAQA